MLSYCSDDAIGTGTADELSSSNKPIEAVTSVPEGIMGSIAATAGEGRSMGEVEMFLCGCVVFLVVVLLTDLRGRLALLRELEELLLLRGEEVMGARDSVSNITLTREDTDPSVSSFSSSSSSLARGFDRELAATLSVVELLVDVLLAVDLLLVLVRRDEAPLPETRGVVELLVFGRVYSS